MTFEKAFEEWALSGDDRTQMPDPTQDFGEPGEWGMRLEDTFSSVGGSVLWRRSRAAGDEQFPEYVDFIVTLKNCGDHMDDAQLRARLGWSSETQFRDVYDALSAAGIVIRRNGYVQLTDPQARIVFSEWLPN